MPSPRRSPISRAIVKRLLVDTRWRGGSRPDPRRPSPGCPARCPPRAGHRSPRAITNCLLVELDGAAGLAQVGVGHAQVAQRSAFAATVAQLARTVRACSWNSMARRALAQAEVGQAQVAQMRAFRAPMLSSAGRRPAPLPATLSARVGAGEGQGSTRRRRHTRCTIGLRRSFCPARSAAHACPPGCSPTRRQRGPARTSRSSPPLSGRARRRHRPPPHNAQRGGAQLRNVPRRQAVHGQSPAPGRAASSELSPRRIRGGCISRGVLSVSCAGSGSMAQTVAGGGAVKRFREDREGGEARLQFRG